MPENRTLVYLFVFPTRTCWIVFTCVRFLSAGWMMLLRRNRFTLLLDPTIDVADMPRFVGSLFDAISKIVAEA